jgi:hypothetical protein
VFGLGDPKGILAQLTNRVAELYRELVTTRVQFEEVRQYTKESIIEFKRLIERDSDKIDRIERDRIRAEAELIAEIHGLEARLSALSESALRAAVGDAAAKYMARIQREEASVEPKRLEREVT